MKKIFTLIAIVILTLNMLFALSAKPTEVISIPAGDIIGAGKFNLSYYNSGAINLSEDKVAFDYNLALSYGLFDVMDVTLHMYTYKDYAMQMQFALLKQSSLRPAVSFGVKNITYERYIDEGGGGSDVNSGLADYAYTSRSSDIFSAYISATEDLGMAGRYTVGIGRGEFIGYGRGRYLSSVAFFNTDSLEGTMLNEFMFGFFAGAELPITKNLTLKADVDGRDVNAGMQFEMENLSINAALTHCELFTAVNSSLSPRIELGINYTFDFNKSVDMPKSVKTGYLTVNVLCDEDDEPLDGIVEFLNTALPSMFIEDGNKKIELPAGVYTLSAKSAECQTALKEVTIKAGENTVVFFNMVSSEKSGFITGRILDRTTEEVVIPSIEILGIETSRINVDQSTGIYNVELVPGNYTMYAKKDNYMDWIQPISVEEGKTIIVNINMLKKGGRVSLKNVNFDSGSANLTKSSYPILDEAVAILKANFDVKIEIQGFTDDIGKATNNMLLSQKRADTVKEYLVSKGIEPVRISTRGFGEAMNLIDNESALNRSLNRRIEFIILNQ